MSWDSSHNEDGVMDGYRQPSKDRLRGRGGIALFVREQQGYMELYLVCSDHEMVESRILREGNKANSRIITLDFRSSDPCLTNPLAIYNEMTGLVE